MAVLTDKQFFILGGVALAAAWLLKGKAENAVHQLSPLNPDNVFSSGVDEIGRSITGREGWTLGGAIYEGVDAVYGWFGASDADKLREQEKLLRRQYTTVAHFEKYGGGL